VWYMVTSHIESAKRVKVTSVMLNVQYIWLMYDPVYSFVDEINRV